MKSKKTCLTILLVFNFYSITYCQLTKGNWLLSGSANLSMLKYGSEASIKFKQTNLLIAPSVGYFLMDKLALGIRPSLIYGSNNIGNSEKVFSVGPFIRYYLLKTEGLFNLLTEGGYYYGTYQSSGIKQNVFSFAAGPVLYFNSSVGLEFLIGYSTTKIAHFDGVNNALQFGIGLQFNLEKDK